MDYDELDDALRRSGATWNAALTHGFLCSRIALAGAGAAPDWIGQVMTEAQAGEPPDGCIRMLEALFDRTWRELAERQSQFAPLLPEDPVPISRRSDALAQWCEGFLHGLVSGPHSDAAKSRLAAEPLSEIIKDFLQITRASAETVEARDEQETAEEAYAELVEYIRVATQLAYEELSSLRAPDAGDARPDVMH